ncbi:MAG: HlyD family type I secretion periplasmic adaptor subunit [Gammaproteobacteria bacterium]
MTALSERLDPAALDFAPGLLALQARPPSPLPRTMGTLIVLLVASLIAWSAWGRVEIIAMAEGRLVPKTYVKIVQPAEGGILKDILVNEGDHVQAGQVLMRMDRQLAEADTRILENAIAQRMLQLARIDAELTDRPLALTQSIPSPLAGEGQGEGASQFRVGVSFRSLDGKLIEQVRAQYHARRRAHEDALAEEQAAMRKAKEDLAAAGQVREKLAALLPTYRQEEAALAKLGERRLAAELDVLERRRRRIQTEQDLKTQERTLASLRAAVAQSGQRLNQVTSRYREQLQNERIEAQAELDRLTQERAKQQHRNTLLELKAPQDGIVKDVATHTPGAVVSPGTILLTLVPHDEPLQAEVMIRNEDIGFVREGQTAKVKLAAYPFQKYGLVQGTVVHVGADAEEGPEIDRTRPQVAPTGRPYSALRYKATVRLQDQALEKDGRRFELSAGMQVVAEIDQGRRTPMEYLLSPIQKTLLEAARER